MKKLTSIALTLALPAVALPGLVSAGQPTDVTILHCGCSESGYELEWVQLDLNTKGAAGHEQHRAAQFETCTLSSGGTLNYQRVRSDCEVVTDLTPLRTCGTVDIDDYTYGYDCD